VNLDASHVGFSATWRDCFRKSGGRVAEAAAGAASTILTQRGWQDRVRNESPVALDRRRLALGELQETEEALTVA